jgi:uncharacterized protein (DUF3084 family)
MKSSRTCWSTKTIFKTKGHHGTIRTERSARKKKGGGMFETQIRPTKETMEVLEQKIETLTKAAQAAKFDNDIPIEARTQKLNNATNQLKSYVSRMCSRAFKYGQENKPVAEKDEKTS